MTSKSSRDKSGKFLVLLMAEIRLLLSYAYNLFSKGFFFRGSHSVWCFFNDSKINDEAV